MNNGFRACARLHMYLNTCLALTLLLIFGLCLPLQLAEFFTLRLIPLGNSTLGDRIAINITVRESDFPYGRIQFKEDPTIIFTSEIFFFIWQAGYLFVYSVSDGQFMFQMDVYFMFVTDFLCFTQVFPVLDRFFMF